MASRSDRNKAFVWTTTSVAASILLLTVAGCQTAPRRPRSIEQAIRELRDAGYPTTQEELRSHLFLQATPMLALYASIDDEMEREPDAVANLDVPLRSAEPEVKEEVIRWLEKNQWVSDRVRAIRLGRFHEILGEGRNLPEAESAGMPSDVLTLAKVS